MNYLHGKNRAQLSGCDILSLSIYVFDDFSELGRTLAGEMNLLGRVDKNL